jgi:protein-tyrosine phosphatase
LILNEVNPEKFESVPDPYYGGDDGFQNIYNMLDDACNKIISQIE